VVTQPSVVVLGSQEVGGNVCLSCLEAEGFRLIRPEGEKEARDPTETGNADVIVAVVPNVHPEQLLSATARLKRSGSQIPLIILVEGGSEDLAIAALRLGADDYFHVPQEEALFRQALRKIRESSAPNGVRPQTAMPQDALASPFIGDSPPMLDLRVRLSRIATTNMNVLITGETGTGKELAAIAIHRLSPRRNQLFTCINCAAIPDTLFESELFGYERGAFTGAIAARRGLLEGTHGGTVFLDEIGDLQPAGQAKLLRVIENKEIRRIGAKSTIIVDLRFVAATHQDLGSMIAQKTFREDLYFRLNVIRVQIPPLRSRRSDIPALLLHYIDELNSKEGRGVAEISDEVWECLMAYPWPGNIRELKNLVDAAYANSEGPRIRIEDLPEEFKNRAKECGAGGLAERELLLATLLCTKWNKSKAAEKLHWSRMTLYRKMVKYRIPKDH